MKQIFEFVLKGGEFEKMLNEDTNLVKNKELCKGKALEILGGFADKSESTVEN